MFYWIPVSPTRHPRCRVNDELGHENDGVAPATIFFIVSGIQKKHVGASRSFIIDSIIGSGAWEPALLLATGGAILVWLSTLTR